MEISQTNSNSQALIKSLICSLSFHTQVEIFRKIQWNRIWFYNSMYFIYQIDSVLQLLSNQVDKSL